MESIKKISKFEGNKISNLSAIKGGDSIATPVKITKPTPKPPVAGV